MKGYVARKKYGPLINPESGKMNKETAKFIRPYFKKWKNRSLYQILMKHKAARRLDFSYFCQQVHLYNQNTVSALQINENERVDFRKLRANVKSDKFIGKERPAVWKIPFNIKDLPVCDSSLLCRSTDVRFMRTDETPWDQPFRCLNKASQTLITIKGNCIDLVKPSGNTNRSFTDVPYHRDPTVADSEYGKQFRYRNEEDSLEQQGDEMVSQFLEFDHSLRAKRQDKRPTNLKTSGSYQNQRFSTPYRSNAGPVNHSNPVKIPLTERREFSDDDDENKAGIIDFRKNLKPTKIMKKSDPILELEMKGKAMGRNSDQNEDDPPFNFQAMLRKTGYNNSIRRGVSSEIDFRKTSTKKRSAKDSAKENEQPDNIESMNNNNIMQDKRKNLFRKDSLENLKLMLSTTKDFKSTSPIIENGNYYDETEGDIVRTELAPGLVVVGKVTDL